jgi:hypothetical protein
VSITATDLGDRPLPDQSFGLVDAYQLAAQEIEQVQRLPWQDLKPCENAPWRFGDRDLCRLNDARGRLTIVEAFEGSPTTKQIIVALEWEHRRQGRRTVRLVTLVNQTA